MNGMYGGMGYQPYQPGTAQQFAMDQMQQYQQRAQMQQPGMQLIRVTGMEGAKAYQMPPNSAVPLFDADSDVMYVKTTDGAGFPTIRAFSFKPIGDPAPAAGADQYVTRAEFDQTMALIKEAISGAQQPVQQPAAQPAASDQRQPV